MPTEIINLPWPNDRHGCVQLVSALAILAQYAQSSTLRVGWRVNWASLWAPQYMSNIGTIMGGFWTWFQLPSGISRIHSLRGVTTKCWDQIMEVLSTPMHPRTSTTGDRWCSWPLLQSSSGLCQLQHPQKDKAVRLRGHQSKLLWSCHLMVFNKLSRS